MNKKVILLMILITLIVLAGCKTIQTPTKTTSVENISANINKSINFLTYTNTDENISIEYPESWNYLEGVVGTTVFFYAPEESKDDNYKENFNIVVEELPEAVSFEELRQASLLQIKKYVPESKIQVFKEMTLNGYQAQLVVYTGKQETKTDSINLKWLQIWILKDHTGYYLSYTAQESHYTNYRDIIQHMINSFTILK